jgi:hypothetical protein
MTPTGTVSDYESASLLGLIVTDDGGVLPFNLQGTPQELRGRFARGTRVRFIKRAAAPTARAVEVIPIGNFYDERQLGGGAREGRGGQHGNL